MDIESIRADGYVNRWSLIAREDGTFEPRCVEDAILVSDPAAPMAAARNAAIAEGVATPEAVEARALELLPAVAMPVPNSISDRQFFQALAVSGLISKDEAIQAVSIGEIPAKIAATVDLMPDDYAFDARMFFSGAYTFERHHPFTEMFAAMSGFSPSQADDLFRLASNL